MSVNEQLSKLCNIEPLIEDSCKISDRYWKNSHKIKGIHDDYVQRYCKYDMDCTTKCKHFYEKVTYPDFTKPSNFVRLYNLLTETGSTVASLIAYEFHPVDTDTFVEDVLLFCKRSEKDPEAIEATIEAIERTEWDYE